MSDANTQKIVIESAGPTTYSTIPTRFLMLSRGAWLVVSIGTLAMAILGIPARYAELLIPCPTAQCATSQFTTVEQAAMAGAGVSMSAYIIFFEVVANLFVVACLIPAAIIYWRRQNSLIAFVASQFLITIAVGATFNADALARSNPAATLPFALLSAIQSSLAVVLFYLFPNGRAVPRWTRWVVIGWAAYRLAGAFVPGISAAINTVAPMLTTLLSFLILVGGVGSQVYRYVKVATPPEREQMKWIILAIMANVVVYIITVIEPLIVKAEQPLPHIIEGDILFFAYILTFLLIPVSMVFSILRYRLWDIDFIINRSLIYGALTLSLLLVFTVSALALQQLFSLLTGGQQAPIALAASMLVAGLLFNPVRTRLRQFVDRRLYGIQIDYVRAARVQDEILHPHLQALARPVTLGDYGNLELIGRGGMADVYRGLHPTLQRTVAIKVMRPGMVSVADNFSKRFEREARILASLRHPNIIQLYDFGVAQEGLLFMVIEYISGKDLASTLIDVKTIPLGETLGILKDVASALDHAHQQGLVHRDIKPSNIMLEPVTAPGGSRRYRAVLTDFGIAKVSTATQLTASNMIGTFDYIAPEQIRDAADVDGRADIYALGIVLYQMLTGQRPFSAMNPAAILIAHLNQPAPDPRSLSPELPPQVAMSILRAMSKNPAERYSTAGEMMAAMAA